MSDRIIYLVITLFSSAVIVRYLGAEQYGTLSIALSFIALITPVVRLGIDQIAIRALLGDTAAPGTVLGTTLILRLVACLILVPPLILIAYRLYPTQPEIGIITAILSIGLIFDSLSFIDLWNQAHLHSAHTVWARNIAFFASTTLKLLAVYLQMPLVVFGALYALDFVISFVALTLIDRKRREQKITLRWDRKFAKELISMSFPLLLSAVAISVYMRIDQVMLSVLANDSAAVGVYSVAVRLSEMWYFIPTAIVSSLLPSILLMKKNASSLYHVRLQRLFNLMAFITYMIALPITILAPFIIEVLYGVEFADAAPQLIILTWTGLWVALGVARGAILLAEELVIISTIGTILGALVNIFLNFLLIPIYGGLGCAVATFISYSLSAWLSSFISPRSASFGLMQLKAIVFPNPLRKQ